MELLSVKKTLECGIKAFLMKYTNLIFEEDWKVPKVIKILTKFKRDCVLYFFEHRRTEARLLDGMLSSLIKLHRVRATQKRELWDHEVRVFEMRLFAVCAGMYCSTTGLVLTWGLPDIDNAVIPPLDIGSDSLTSTRRPTTLANVIKDFVLRYTNRVYKRKRVIKLVNTFHNQVIRYLDESVAEQVQQQLKLAIGMLYCWVTPMPVESLMDSFFVNRMLEMRLFTICAGIYYILTKSILIWDLPDIDESI